jgi:mRNA interferase MazF
MAIREHPLRGTVLLCDFGQGFREPEMIKRRPVIVISPKIHARPSLCTVVALSTTEPFPKMSYHAQLDINPPLPEGLQSNGLWIKGDMVNAVGFHRLDFIRTGKKPNGSRSYYMTPISQDQMKIVQKCVLAAIGLNSLTTHL